MPARLSQITMRNFWEKAWPGDGKYPIDFTRIGFHPIKRALARFTGMLCLPRAAALAASSCKLTSLPHAAAAASPRGRGPGARSRAGGGIPRHPTASHGSEPRSAVVAALPTALLVKQAQKAASLSNYKKIYTCTGS